MSDSPSLAARPPSRRTVAATRRREREQEIIDATRALFDERGASEAQIEEISRAVGVNRAIVYRHFTGKDELFALVLVGYLGELHAALVAANGAEDPTERLTDLVDAFAAYAEAHPAFVDCSLSLMRRTGPELLDEISAPALFRLGRGISGCLAVLVDVLEYGVTRGAFTVADPHAAANTLYACGLGTMQLARVGILVKEAAPGVPTIARLSPDQVRDDLVAIALGLVARPAG